MKHLIKYALIALAAVAAYYVFGFTAMIAPWWVAVASAGSLVATYVGLAFADIPTSQQRRARAVAYGAMAIEAIYGTLYVLHVQSPLVFAAPMPLVLSVALAMLHGASFSVLAFFVSMFVVHERAIEQPDAQAQALTMLVTRLDSIADALATRPMLPQASFERPQEHPAVVATGGCCSCGAAPLRGQKGTIAQGKQWRCAACGTMNAGKEGSK